MEYEKSKDICAHKSQITHKMFIATTRTKRNSQLSQEQHWRYTKATTWVSRHGEDVARRRAGISTYGFVPDAGWLAVK